ncbi:DUF6711 family protein [Enterococcus sp. AZ103]|uniref:DUF6711 family protein n=1 Tax=Enterococcus sp. AZ103 TaxID=2774628 RepID=UPI003F2759AA
MSEIIASGVALPSPTEIGISDEVIWSSGTGRNANGDMVGDLITEKKTVSIKWGILTLSELNKIRSYIQSGFFPVQILGYNLTVYRGTIQSEYLGQLSDGVTYYKSASVNLIQK